MSESKEVITDKTVRPNTSKLVKEGGYVGQTSVSNPKLPQGGSAIAPVNTTTTFKLTDGLWPVSANPSGGFFCAGSYFEHRHDAEHQSEKMKEAYAKGRKSMELEAQENLRLQEKLKEAM